MTNLNIRNFIPADIGQITALQKAYQRTYPHAPVIPGEVYLSPGYESGRNIFCVFDEKGILQGYAPVFPVLTEAPNLPHTVWTEVKALPGADQLEEVKDLLYERVLARAQEATAAVPGHATHLTFQYHPSETASIDYVTSRDCVHTENVYRLKRNLLGDLPVIPTPESIQVRRWQLDSEPELQAYVRARNEAFPEAPVTLEDWRGFMASPAWKDGTTITAFDNGEVVGGVSAYWDETLSQMAGCRAGYTEYIFVRSRWQRRGIAAYLITQAMEYLKECDKEAAFLEVKASNEKALELYIRLGYRVVDETRFYVMRI
jgi:ribosomal protein S18 acetylase RimI-like enzyme